MSSKYFFDTNIFIYAFDVSFPDKQHVARKSIEDLVRSGQGVISTQVINEFYVVLTKRFKFPAQEARKHLDNLLQFEVVEIDVPLIKEAVDCSILDGINYWDALLIVSAARAGCDYLLTEDLNHGQTIKGVTVRNIFK